MCAFTITTAFPGGNALVESIEGATVRLRQDLRDTTSWWFYWQFRVDGAAGQTLTFQFTDGDVFGPLGPCMSRDGEHWQWLGHGVVTDELAFAYTFPAEQDSAYFAYCIPYQEARLRRFLAAHPAVQVDTLCLSEGGRPVEHLLLPSQRGTEKVLFTARHHACESMANYEMEGIMAYWQADEPEAAFLREHVDLHFVPFVDKDGVEQGDQGKNRAPHDHNRDYTPTPHYASVHALMLQAAAWRGAFPVMIDLHCPWIRGGWNEEVQVIEPSGIDPETMARFLDVFHHGQTGEIHFDRAHVLHAGDGWNTGTAETSTRFFRNQVGVDLVFSLEFPYAVVGGVPVTVENSIQFGRDLARTVARYLRSLP